MKIFGIAGWSGAGKTTLLEKLVSRFRARGLRVAVVKHAHVRFDVDRPGKDSHRMREAGATQVLVSSPNRWALMRELAGEPEAALDELIGLLGPCDLVLVEGWKREAIPKLEVHRVVVGKPLIAPDDRHVVAIASDAPVASPLPRLALDDLDAIAALVEAHALDRDAALAALRAARPAPPLA